MFLELLEIDFQLLKFINQVWTHSWLDVFFPFITDLHKTLAFRVLIPFTLLGLYLFKFKKKGLLFFFSGLLSLAISDWTGSNLFKKQFQRPRPAETLGLEVLQRSPSHGFSFISNHSSNMFNFAITTSYYFPGLKIPLYSFAALVAYSRVYNGVHFPSDVIFGALWGLLTGFGVLRITKLVEKRFFP